MSGSTSLRLTRLVERAVRIYEETLPSEVLDAAKCAILNDLTCAAIATGPLLHKAETLAGTTTAFPDGVATVLGTGSRHSPVDAAFMGGIRMHAHALDSTHYASQAHPGAAIIPAAMAMAEKRGVAGARLFAAIVAGWETAALIGETFVNGVLARGLRASTTFGALGSATAAALVTGLTACEITDALALSVNLSAGLTRTFLDGSDDWAVQLGLAAQTGVQAVHLVQAGFRGATGILQQDGLPLLWGANEAVCFAALDRELTTYHPTAWRILDTVYKRYSACNISQGPIALAVDLHPHLDSEISEVRCFLNPKDHRYPGVLTARPESFTTALMSVPYSVASALIHGTFDIDRLHYPQRDTGAAHLCRLVQVLPDTAIPPLGARLAVSLTDGRVLNRDLIQGQDAFRYSWKQVKGVCAERRQAAGHPSDQHERLVSAVASIRDVPSVASLLRAMRAP